MRYSQMYRAKGCVLSCGQETNNDTIITFARSVHCSPMTNFLRMSSSNHIITSTGRSPVLAINCCSSTFSQQPLELPHSVSYDQLRVAFNQNIQFGVLPWLRGFPSRIITPLGVIEVPVCSKTLAMFVRFVTAHRAF